MRRFELLIEDARRRSLNKDYGTNRGISQEEFVQFGNEAQRNLFREIIKVNPRFGKTDKTASVVDRQEAYSVPSDLHIGQLSRVEFSASGQVADYYPLDLLSISQRNSEPGGNPYGYIRDGNRILLVPPGVNNSALVRYNFVKRPSRLEVRRASITAVTLSSTQLTALTVLSSDLTTLDPGGELAKHNYISIVSNHGQVKMKGIEYTSVNTGTGVFTLPASHTFESGETAAIGDYIVLGQDSCNLPEFQDDAEDYLINYMVYCALGRDNSDSGQERKADCMDILGSIVSSYGDGDGEPMSIPILQTEDLLGMD